MTPLHHDTLMLFHTQVVGRKRWRFVSPLEWSRVYNERNVFSEVDLERPDPAHFSAFDEATVLEVVVEPGETMFLPLGWWHQVAALDVSLSFSYLCLSVPNQFEYPDPALRNSPTNTRLLRLRGSDVDEVTEQFEASSPLLAITVERGGALVDAHDQADWVLQVLVGEGHPVSEAEVGTAWDLWWRARPGEFHVCRCRTTFS